MAGKERAAAPAAVVARNERRSMDGLLYVE
jgi:hypothetical protein